MSREDTLRAWSQRPSDTEQARIDRTERMVREAISRSPDYRIKNATVFAKGSVKMRTNIRRTSDIDVCVQASDVFFTDYPSDTTDKDFDNREIDYTFADFRKGIENALQDYFEHADVDVSGNKAICVRATATSSRIDADIVPAFEHRRYIKPGSSDYHQGIELRPKNEPIKKVVNWPEHNYQNVLEKQDSTAKRYRKMVRILKRMREAMKEAGYQTAHDAHSFLLESLLWNVPHGNYGNIMYEDDMTNILDFLAYNLAVYERVKEWGEVNELKYLFRPQQKWSRQEAEAFIDDARSYMADMT
jgi:Ni/Co efflux regulator RcnB